MKQRRHKLTLYALLLLALNILYWKKPQPERKAAVEVETQQVTVGSPQAAIAAPVESQEAVRPTVLAQATEDKEEAVIPLEDTTIDTIVNAVDPMKANDFSKAIAELQRLPPEKVSAYFLDNLRKIGPDHGFERDRIVMLANSMQLKTDLPLWEDLARRQTPRYIHEEELRNPKHPTFESRFIDMEQLQAIRNIGLLARDDRQARRVLVDIILNPSVGVHRTLHREEAYTALKESDIAASLRVLKQLAADDDLLKRL